MLHIGLQNIPGSLGVSPGFGGQNLNTLSQQHGSLALNLHPVLQILNNLDAVGQLHLEQRQRLTRQRGPCLGRITLPCQGIGDIELGGCQQRLGLFGPFGSN